jgi:hypothetical protein
MGWLALALGFLAFSFAEDKAQPGRFQWTSPAAAVGTAGTAAGVGILIYGLFR